MQDWNYLQTNCFEVTIELGCVKYPFEKDLPKFWEQNRRSLIQFLKQVTILEWHEISPKSKKIFVCTCGFHALILEYTSFEFQFDLFMFSYIYLENSWM